MYSVVEPKQFSKFDNWDISEISILSKTRTVSSLNLTILLNEGNLYLENTKHWIKLFLKRISVNLPYK